MVPEIFSEGACVHHVCSIEEFLELASVDVGGLERSRPVVHCVWVLLQELMQCTLVILQFFLLLLECAAKRAAGLFRRNNALFVPLDDSAEFLGALLRFLQAV